VRLKEVPTNQTGKRDLNTLPQELRTLRKRIQLRSKAVSAKRNQLRRGRKP